MCFYSNGLRFHCTRCSRCCRHDPGYVLLSEDDIDRLARGLGMSQRSVIDDYCRTISIGPFKRLSLNEQANYDCIFWQNGACVVYEHRPYQCSSYPFWPGNVADKGAWEATAQECPGVDIGRLYAGEDIDGILSKRNPPVSLDD